MRDGLRIGIAGAFLALTGTLFMPVITVYSENYTVKQLLKGRENLDIAEDLPYIGDLAGGVDAFLTFLIVVSILCAAFPLAESAAVVLVKNRAIPFVAAFGVVVNILLKAFLIFKVRQVDQMAGSILGWFSDDVENTIYASPLPLVIWFAVNGAVIAMTVAFAFASRRGEGHSPGAQSAQSTREETAAGKKCRCCGATFPPQTNFCTRCGRPLG